MKTPQIIALAFLSCIFINCGSDDDGGGMQMVNRYENCCDLVPLEADFNPGKVYIPNMITPNADGINDVFFVHTDDGIDQVVEIQIFDSDDKLVFEGFNAPPNTVASDAAWAPTGDMELGSFRYTLRIRNTNADEFDLSGSFCAFICEADHPFDFTDQCGFPAQHSGEGEFDPVLPNFEPDC